MSVDNRIRELGLELPPAPKAIGVYKSALVVGNLCYTAGHAPVKADGTMITGCVGRDADQQAGYDAARQTGLTLLSTLKDHFGSLDRIARVVKILGMVCCSDDFEAHPAVINGCSELMKEVFGPDAGVGARSAIGVNSLPMGIIVEIEGIFEIRNG